MLYHYKEHFHLSEVQVTQEPWEAIERHYYISELRRKRDKLEEEKRQLKSR